MGAEVIKKWMLWETMRTKREAFSTVYSESFDNDPKHIKYKSKARQIELLSPY